MASTRKRSKAQAEGAGGGPAEGAAAAGASGSRKWAFSPPDGVACTVCGKTTGGVDEWTVFLKHELFREGGGEDILWQHYDCWSREDPSSALVALPARHILDITADLLKLRRENRDVCRLNKDVVKERDEALRLRDAAAAGRDAAAAGRDAAATRAHQLHVERQELYVQRDKARSEYESVIAQRDAAITQRDRLVTQRDAAITQRDAALGLAFEKLEDGELEALQSKLGDTLKKVALWQAARAAVERAYPDCCCSITQSLMHDPVCVVDGHCYERKELERHFAKLREQGLPLRTPHRTHVDTTEVVPNMHLRNMINCLVAAKAKELAAAAEAQERGEAAPP